MRFRKPFRYVVPVMCAEPRRDKIECGGAERKLFHPTQLRNDIGKLTVGGLARDDAQHLIG